MGFRPFFLGAGVMALILMVLWSASTAGLWLPGGSTGTPAWHGHEMLFGYTAAVVAGFLLTAVRNWTGMETATGNVLVLLALLWLGARVVRLFDSSIALGLAALADVSFLLALALVIARPILASGQRHNTGFPLILMAMAVAGLLVDLDRLGLVQGGAHQGVTVGLYLVLALIAVISGRVIPFFTGGPLPSLQIQRNAVLDWAAITSIPVVATVDLLGSPPLFMVPAAGAAALLHGLRQRGWKPLQTRGVPLLWVLHLGYAWMVVGFALKTAAASGLVAPNLALHAFTVGVIGTFTLGMMARVALGHTGRPLQPAGLTVAAFGAINLAAATRSLLPAVAPTWYPDLLILSGVLWILAFAAFLYVYAPILWQPRADGRPG